MSRYCEPSKAYEFITEHQPHLFNGILYTLLDGRGSIGMAYNSNTLYLFYGYGCEYSLSHLAGYMKDKGYNVLELDMLKIKNVYDILSGIRGKPVVFTTSWHLFFDKRNFDYFIHGDENTQCSPLEIIDFKPIRSILPAA